MVDALGGPQVVGVMGNVRYDDGNYAEDELDSDNYGQMVYMFQRGRILVRDVDVDRVLRVLGIGAEGNIGQGGLNGVTVLFVENTMEALAQVDRTLGVGVAFPDHVLHITWTGSACPATEPVPAPMQHPYSVREDQGSCRGAGVFTAVVDTGFDPKLAAQTPWLERGVAGQAESYNPDHLGPYAGHGTFAAGVIRAMAIDTEIYVFGFLLQAGAIFESDILDRLRAALVAAPDIISLQGGTHTRGDLGMLGFRVLWENFALKGTALIAAAGNNNSRKPFYPAADRCAIGVGALDAKGGRAGFSNYGSWVDVYALGTDLVNAFPEGTYFYEQAPKIGQSAAFHPGMAVWSGTSFSTPLVSGIIAARMSRTGESGEQASNAIVALAQANATPGVGAIVEPWMACPSDE